MLHWYVTFIRLVCIHVCSSILDVASSPPLLSFWMIHVASGAMEFPPCSSILGAVEFPSVEEKEELQLVVNFNTVLILL